MRHRSNRDESISYLAVGQLEPVETRTPLDELMDAEELDEMNEMDAAGMSNIPPDALLTILRFLIPKAKPGSNRNAKRWEAAKMRLIVLAHAAGLQGVADRSLASIASEVGCSRALLSLFATRMIDELGQEAVRGGKRRSSRAIYREKATAYHASMGHRMAAEVES